MAGRSARRGVFSWPTRLERQIALRYLRGRRRSYAPSLNTVIAVGGIAVGVAALLVVLGVMNGLRDDLRDRILVGNPHLRILVHGTSLRMDDWQVALGVIREDSEVVAAAPRSSPSPWSIGTPIIRPWWTCWASTPTPDPWR
jgi:ABC-type lipoprotein release transport system permease subunit